MQHYVESSINRVLLRSAIAEACMRDLTLSSPKWIWVIGGCKPGHCDLGQVIGAGSEGWRVLGLREVSLTEEL
jgi:hypothetical protein